MRKEGVPCPLIDIRSQCPQNGIGCSAQCFLLGCLGFVTDSQLIRIAIAGTHEGRPDTLTTGVSS